MKRRPFVQRTSARKQVLRRRRIHTSFAETWQRMRGDRSDAASRPHESAPSPVVQPA